MRRVLVAAALLPAALTGVAPAGADTPTPVLWPDAPPTQAILDTTAHTIRFGGPDRYQTNLATTLALRGRGSSPFTTSDRTSGGATGLASAVDWWGLRTCPVAVLLVAGDMVADALSAASLSDPTDQSDEPRLERVAAADPLFDPVGGFDRVDTDSAPIIVTRSARQGATALAPAARLALADLAAGGCRAARDVVIVGGDGAVAPSVESELLSLGYDEVFRVAGLDRYDTAARIATALGTEAAPTTGCADPRADDGTHLGFYGNAVIEVRASATSCRLLGRTVALADGATGADALAAGWWTSYWQVPVLLTAPDGSLPTSTLAALRSLDIDNLVVLGGSGRIPAATVDQASLVASAQALRIAGTDRYATSVEMARTLGGWFPASTPDAAAGSIVCLAASSGTGSTSAGWPDALAAGPWCGRLAGQGVSPPARALPPVGGPGTLAHDAGVAPARDAAPVLLVPSGATSLPAPVLAFLESVFSPDLGWCDGDVPATTPCSAPGFGVVFGGAGALPDGVVQQLARLVSGGRYTDLGDLAPSLGPVFATTLDLSPVFAMLGEVGAPWHGCALRADVASARWLSFTADGAGRTFLSESDLADRGAYGAGGQSAPVCGGVTPLSSGEVTVRAVSLSGHASAGETLHLDRDHVLTLDQGLSLGPPRAADGQPSESDGQGGATSWSFAGPVDGNARSRDMTAALVDAEVVLRLARGVDVPSTFTGNVVLTTDSGTVEAAVGGEAVFTGTAWELRGRALVTGGSWNAGGGAGGFTATIDVRAPGNGDDHVAWDLDATLP